MDVHLFGPVALVRAVLPHMRRQRAGWIVQISSVGGRLSFPGVAAYSASKFALEGLSEALACELEPLGVRVLIVRAGRVPHRSAQRSGPGDPRRAAKAIQAVLDAEKPPLRLVLGDDAVDPRREDVARATRIDD
jgi:NAD(P)-dependent dehydrogenase (short-subunit alcohol dehydrogenase family)